SGLAHLWFLYYLILFYFGTYLYIKVLDFRKRKLHKPAIGLNANFLVILVVTVLLTSILTAFNNHLIPPVYTGLKIQIFNLSYYLIFYVLGWILNHRLNVLNDLSRYSFVISSIGLALAIFSTRFQNREIQPLVIHIFSAAQTVLLVLGITGLFLKLFNRETVFWRYCSDASYWMYLVHLVIIVWLQILFMNSAVSPGMRLTFVLAVTLIITLATYHFFVRNTFIGNILNGKKRV
ncbi:MAG: hypothetical protein EOO89_19500, partial [Pedobacter sp.]